MTKAEASPTDQTDPGSTSSDTRSLALALSRWVNGGDSAPLLRWLGRELDPDGVPRRLPVAVWPGILDDFDAARLARPHGWPLAVEALSEGVLKAIFRFGRPDGSVIFGPAGPDLAHRARLRTWAESLADPALVAVARRWAPDPRRDDEPPGPPPLPAHCCPDRPLAILRPDWSSRGDWLAVDHRGRDGRTLLELAGLGRRWLGPTWSSGLPTESANLPGPARPTLWTTGFEADLAEWTFDTPVGRVVRLALLLRGRGLALLADQLPGRADPSTTMTIETPPGLVARPAPDGRGLILAAGRSGSARVIPLGLASTPDSAGRGALTGTDGAIQLRGGGGRRWLPLLISWNPDRNRRPLSWFPLTVTENSQICPPDVAFAARVAWGLDEGLVIYRSLAPPGLRTFLGHQTRARFLVGRFARDGIVRPLVKVEG